MPSFSAVQFVVRAIELLQALDRQPVSNIDMLHRQTDFPKPSIVRLLQALEAKGLARHAPQPGAYYLTSGVATLSMSITASRAWSRRPRRRWTS